MSNVFMRSTAKTVFQQGRDDASALFPDSRVEEVLPLYRSFYTAAFDQRMAERKSEFEEYDRVEQEVLAALDNNLLE